MFASLSRFMLMVVAALVIAFVDGTFEASATMAGPDDTGVTRVSTESVAEPPVRAVGDEATQILIGR